MEKALEADKAEAEHEQQEKEAVLAKIASSKAVADEQAKQLGPSRGKRNKDSLFTYIRSMGNVWFPVFCVFTVANIGFRAAQRKNPLP